MPNPECVAAGVAYMTLAELLVIPDVVSLHCPLTPQTRHRIDATSIAGMKRGVMLIDTRRGGPIETQAVIDALKEGMIGHLGLDVYVEEADQFFEDSPTR